MNNQRRGHRNGRSASGGQRLYDSSRYEQRQRRRDKVSLRQFDRLSEWVEENRPTDLLLRLENQYFGCLLEAPDHINAKLMIAILKAIVKCTKSENRVLLNRFLSTIASKSLFFRLHVNEYVNELVNQMDLVPEGTDNYKQIIEPKLHSVCDLVLVLKELLCLFPSQMSPVCFPLCNIVKNIRQINHSKKFGDDVIRHLTTVESEVEKLKVPESTITDENGFDPPNDFRSISVTPTPDDFHNENPFLRKNIVDSHYRNADHYLDIQFRLLREDFIRPLRKGVAEYLKAVAAGHRVYRLHDSFIYHNVRVNKVELSETGLSIKLKLDAATLPRINWKTSRRLMSGSLICFSSNRFEDFIIATIDGSYREIRHLERGDFHAVIDPTYELKFFAKLNENPDDLFVVIEPLSYFEAYRHILKTLQQFTEDTFPLKKYIINVESHSNHPEYLNSDTIYDVSSSIVEHSDNDDNNDGSVEELNGTAEPDLNIQEVNVLKAETWPTVKESGLDETQYNAVMDALTKELSVIQGPPGTGKTFIGLRVVETLMKNRHAWDDDGSYTILVTCYTNHALDQFLEGIEPFCKQLLRIGGRCRSFVLQKYCLKDMKRGSFSSNHYIRTQIRDIRKELHDSKGNINSVLSYIKQIRRYLLPGDFLEVLREEISEEHWNSVKSSIKKGVNEKDFQRWLKDWLGYYIIDNLNLESQAMEVVEDDEEAQRLADERYQEAGPDCHDSDNYSDDEAEDSKKFTSREEKFQRFFSMEVNNDDIMSAEEARRVNSAVSIRFLSLKDRWRLYRLWVKLYIKSVTKAECEHFEANNTGQLRERLEALRLEEILTFIGNVKIIGVTTTGAAKNRELINRLRPKIVIVEEAAEILESHVIASLTADTKHLILIGDHIQLQPSSTVHELAVRYNLNVSLFERLIRNNLNYSKLKIQHRMHPNISQLLVPLFYSELEDHESVAKYEPILGLSRNVFFMDHSYSEAVVSETKSRFNTFEVHFAYRLCKHLLLQGYKPSQITVLTMYSAQMFQIRNLMKKTRECFDIRVSVVDNFQGEENDIIICSFVRSNAEGDIGFLKTPNRINVAISRAKKGFYAIGNFEKMAEVSEDIWRPLVEKLKARGFYGTALELYCQSHHETKLFASIPEDFDQFPEGCCLEPCNKRLSCGHGCPKSCHVYDMDHVEVLCRNRCLTVACDKGHRCPKDCHFPRECGRCVFKVEKQRYCGHTQTIECYRDADKNRCESRCNKTLTCGHKCMKVCGEDCSKSKCKEIVWVIPPCGHSNVGVACWLKEDKQELLDACTEPCNEVLKCEHRCSGSCGECFQGKLHKKCSEKCERVLICGHLCKFPCAKNCPPCERVCENSCPHRTKCNHRCGTLCPPCRKECICGCQHSYCDQLCSESCNQLFAPCNRRLNCGHRCIGIGGWKCPKLCRTCDKEIVEKKFFGNESNSNACFVELSNCGHTFEAQGLYQKCLRDVKSSEENDWVPKCPECQLTVKQIPFDMLKSMKDFPECNNFVHGCKRRNQHCRHPCIGICGEECPDLCRICDKQRVEEIFFGNEDEPEARFIQLSDCRHLFEYSGLKQWISQENSESAAIQMKSCPRCKTTIRKSYVFNTEIQRCLADIESVKSKLVGTREENSRKQMQLQNAFHQLSYKLELRKDRFASYLLKTLQIYEKIIQFNHPTKVDLEKMSNIIEIAEAVLQMFFTGNGSEELMAFNDRLQCIVYFIRYHFDNNEQQLSDIKFELNLLETYRSIIQLKLEHKEFKQEELSLINKVTEMFNAVGRMSDKQFKEFDEIVNEIVNKFGISAKEKNMVLKAMNMEKGHWFKCPNGHPYCITECGGATQIGNCPDCNESIGGTCHQLLPTNTVATDFDGATMSAFDYMAYGLD